MMGKLASNGHFQEIVAKHLHPDDEAALRRFAAVCREMYESVAKSKGHFWLSLVGAAAIGAAGEYAEDAANALLRMRSIRPAGVFRKS